MEPADLIAECLNGAERVANSLARHHKRIEAEELRAVAREVLVREAAKIDPATAAGDAKSHLLWRVQRRLQDWLRLHGPVRELARGRHGGEWVERDPTVSLDALYADEANLYEETAAEPEGGLELGDREALREALADLPPRERAIIAARYLAGQTQEEVAATLEITYERVSQIEARALSRLRARLAPGEPEEPPPPLRPRELEVLTLAAEGLSSVEMAEELGIAKETVKTYRVRLIANLGAKNLMNAVALGFRRGLLT